MFRRFARSFILIFGLLACADAARAASAPPDFQQAKTPSGLVYWHGLQKDETEQVIHFGWRDGVIAAMPGKEGLTRLGPSQMFAGTQAISDGEYYERINDLHATASLSANSETTRGIIRAPRDRLGEVAGLVSESFASPRLSETTIARLRTRFADQAREAEVKPNAIAYQAALTAILGDHFQTRSGRPRSFEAVTRGDIEDWRKAVFSRDDLIIVTSGPLGPEEMGPLIDRAFAPLPQTGAHKKTPPAALNVSARTIVVERDVPQTILLLIGRTGIVPEAGSAKALLGNQILGASTDSRLLNAIRQGLGAAYGISSGTFSVNAAQNLLVISTPVSHDRAKAALETIRATYAAWQEKGVTDAEFQPARARLVNAIQSGERQSGSAAGGLLTLLLDGLGADVFRTREERIKGFSLADINAAIGEKFDRPPLMTIAVTPDAALIGADCVVKTAEEAAACR